MTAMSPQLLSLQTGKPSTQTFHGKAWTSAIYKAPVLGRLALSFANVDGDAQANLKFHGGPDKAVCAFPAEHYPFWRAELKQNAETFGYGAFGENFTITGLPEATVCIGDVYAVGSARVQASQPRQPCVNLARKWDFQALPARMQEVGHTGYYLRVLQAGEVGAGDTLTLLERPYPEFSVQVLNRAMYQDEGGAALYEKLAGLPELAISARRIFRRLLTAE